MNTEQRGTADDCRLIREAIFVVQAWWFLVQWYNCTWYKWRNVKGWKIFIMKNHQYLLTDWKWSRHRSLRMLPFVSFGLEPSMKGNVILSLEHSQYKGLQYSILGFSKLFKMCFIFLYSFNFLLQNFMWIITKQLYWNMIWPVKLTLAFSD